MAETTPKPPPQAPSRATLARSLLVGGLLPVIAFAIVEEIYGTMGGLIAGVAFGIGELIYEKVKFKKIQMITIMGNALVVGLGLLSLFEDNSSFFKLQPAILTYALGIFLIGSSVMGKPFLAELSRKQMPDAPEIVRVSLGAMNWRVGLLLLGVGVLSTYAAFYWSTTAWAFLKGIGSPIILFVYLAGEVIWMRLRARRRP